MPQAFLSAKVWESKAWIVVSFFGHDKSSSSLPLSFSPLREMKLSAAMPKKEE